MSNAKHIRPVAPTSHMRPSAPSRSSLDVIKWFIPVATSLPIALVLEWLTLFGAPASDPGDIAQWSLDRTGLIYLLVLIASEMILLFKLGRSFAHIGHFLVDDHGKNGIRMLAEVALAAVLGTAVFVGLNTVGVALPHWSWRYALMAAVAAVGGGFALIHWETIRESLEWGFLILALAFGIVYVFAVPASTHVSWDDAIHYDGAVAMSYVVDAQYTPADVDASMSSSVVEKEIKEIERSPSANPFKIDDATIARIRDRFDQLDTTGQVKTVKDTKTIAGRDTLASSLIGRIPNAFGLWLGRIFFDDFSGIFYTGKVVSLVVYALTFFLGIRHLKSGKAIVGLIGLIPSALFLATNYSYDAFPLALIAFAFCRYIGDLQVEGRTIDVRALALILIPFALGAATKMVYMPLALAFFFAPRGKFVVHRLRQVFIAASVAVVLVAVTIITIQLAGSVTGLGRSFSDARGGGGVNAPQQIALILADPLRFAGVLLGYLVRFFNPAIYAQPISSDEANRFTYWYYVRPSNATVGDYFTIYSGLTLAWIAVAILVALIDRDKIKDSYYGGVLLKVMTGLGCLVSFFAACSAMYVSFTAVGSMTIAGMQNRYAYPIYAPALLIILNTRFGRKLDLGTNAPLFMGVMTVLLAIEVLYVFGGRF